MKKTNLKETLKQIVGVLLFGYVCIAEAVSTGHKKLRTLPKKVMALCIAAALIVAMIPAYVFAAETTYDLWVGGVQVTSANLVIDSTDSTAITGGSATFDPAANTLTLNKFSYEGDGYMFGSDNYAAVYSGINLTVKLVGTNNVTSSVTGYKNGVAFHVQGALTITDDTADETDSVLNLTGCNGRGLFGEGVLTIENVTVKATGVFGNGIYCENAVNINNAIVNIVSNNSQALYSYDAIRINNSNVTVSSDEHLGVILLDSAVMNISNSTVELTAGIGKNAIFNGRVPDFGNAAVIVMAGDDAASATAADAKASETYKNRYIKIIPAYAVTVNYGVDGVNNKEIAVTKGDTISLENPVIDGYIFMGWYADENFTTAFDFDTPITAATTIYAKFADYEGDKKTLQDAIDTLEADVAQLNMLTKNGGTIDQINAKISAIESQIAALYALKNKYAEADTALKQELQRELQAADAAINAAIAALTTRVQDLEADLAAAKSDISTNTSKVTELTNNLAMLNASLTDLSNKLTNDYATKAELTSAINSAKDTINSAIAALTTRVQDLEADLAAANSKVDTNTSDVAALKSDVAALNTWKAQSQSTIAALEALTATQSADIARLKTAVQSLEAALAAAEARIDDAEDRIAVLEGKVSALETAKQNLDAAVAALNAAINNKADTATLNQKVTDLIAAIAAAEDAAKTYADGKDTALQTRLTAAIATAKGEAITAAENLVNTAKAELQTAINNKADIATLNAKVAELNTAIATAEATAKAYTDSAVTTLNAAIITAKDEAVDAAKDLVDAAKAQLQAAIDNKADTTTVNAAIANLQNAITALQNAKDNYIAADAALKAELEEKIAKAKQEAIDAAKGHIPYIGTNGNWWIGENDTGVDANGIKGDTGADGVGIAKIEKTATNGNVDTYTVTLTNGKTYTFTITNGKDGADGKDGENGKDGLTPFIGENGNWWIGENDTGVKAAADVSIPVGPGNATEAEGVNTVTVVAIVIAGVALLGNVILAVLVLKKKKSLV